MKEKNLVNRKLLYPAAFLLPVVMLGIVFLLRGIYPFGDSTVMTGDAQYQFVDYLSYLKSIVFGNNDFNYSFSKNLGGNMRGFSAYYYMSLLNYLTLPFPSELIPAAQGLVLAVTVGLCSLDFCIMISSLHGARYSNLIFSIAYAFMGFIAVYFQLSMYFTNLAVFPLIILGLIRLTEDRSHFLLYIVTLFIAVLCNYYSGFMICIFCLLFFIYRIMLKAGSLLELKTYAGTALVFALSSCLAAALSAFNLVPALLSLEGEKNVISLGLYRTFPLSRFFSGLYTASFKGNLSTGMPNIYCGGLMVFLLFRYFINSRISKKERILSGLFIAFLIINMYFNPLNVLWHGFNQPIGFPFRYAYMLSFLFIYLSYRGFIEPNERKTRAEVVFFLIFILYSAFLLLAGSETVGSKEVLITASILGMVLLIDQNKRLPVQWVITALLVLTAAELSYNFYSAMGQVELASLSEYREYIRDMNATIEEIKEDRDFYRMEKDVRRTHNDAMQFDYAGLSHFSSSEKKDKMIFLAKLGLRNNGNWAFYPEPSTMLLDSLLGLKHFVSQFHTTPNNYTKIIEDKLYKGYTNEAALPLMFAGSSRVTEMDYRDFGSDPFEFQEAIADALAGKETGIFRKAQVLSVKAVNLKESAEEGFTHYERQNPQEDAYLCYSVFVEEVMDEPEHPECLFAYFDAPSVQDVTLYRYDTDMGPYFGIYRWNIVNFETHTEGDTYEVKLRPNGMGMDIANAYFYYEDRNAVRAFSADITAAPSRLEKMTSSHLKGEISIDSEDKYAVLSIPYDKGWNVLVDGKRAETVPAAGMLLSFAPGTGEHEIDMRYIPKGMYAGNILSIVAFLILCFLAVKRKFRK
ncbi:MAG: YfhO family protein [Lachnospiraceae bacterium]|nr:YfhO family protein [Lachnospiraceae bacterium]